MGVGPHEGWRLRLFGEHVHRAFGHAAYHVGSSLTEKRGWRDVDVRLMLPDAEYDALFGENGDHDAVKPRLWNMAWSALGREMTGLPIDFQFQDITSANADHDGSRGGLIMTDEDLWLAQTSRRGSPA